MVHKNIVTHLAFLVIPQAFLSFHTSRGMTGRMYGMTRGRNDKKGHGGI
ncbi:hypothetical protein MYX06_04890 [Patescibacteria group bacterium AH-259-L05]|nr:hypothetical protein [Patescibacteria group bacterium AH-259-L05]